MTDRLHAEYTTTLPPTNWSSNAISPAIVNGGYTVTNPVSGGAEGFVG
jgi:hypothetical protein